MTKEDTKVEPIIVDVTDPDFAVMARMLLEKIIPGSKWKVTYTTPGPQTKPDRVSWRLEATRL